MTFDLALEQGAELLDAPLFILTIQGNIAQVPVPSGAVLVVLGLVGLLVRGALRRLASGGVRGLLLPGA